MCIPNELTYTSLKNFDLLEIDKSLDYSEYTAIEYLDLMYDHGFFLWMMQDLIQKYDEFSYEGCYGYYPDWNSPEQNDHFEEGLVCFAICFDDDEHRVFLTERQFFRYAKQACLRFVELHPEHRDFVMNIVDNWKPKYPDKFPD